MTVRFCIVEVLLMAATSMAATAMAATAMGFMVWQFHVISKDPLYHVPLILHHLPV